MCFFYLPPFFCLLLYSQIFFLLSFIFFFLLSCLYWYVYNMSIIHSSQTSNQILIWINSTVIQLINELTLWRVCIWFKITQWAKLWGRRWSERFITYFYFVSINYSAIYLLHRSWGIAISRKTYKSVNLRSSLLVLWNAYSCAMIFIKHFPERSFRCNWIQIVYYESFPINILRGIWRWKLLLWLMRILLESCFWLIWLKTWCN